jgi:hypothetical protein
MVGVPPDPGTPRAEYQRGWREGFKEGERVAADRDAMDPELADEILIDRLTQILKEHRELTQILKQRRDRR